MSDFSNVHLQGHAAAVFEQLCREHAEGRLAHALLISGPEGIGKATLARAFASYLLGRDAAAQARLKAGSHADFLVIAREYDEKKEELAREITAEQTRHIPEFLSLTAGEGAWRVVLVDDADSMNAHAANAMLKILEEPPPQTIIMLVAHQAGRLLTTIRSRCRHLKVQPLSRAACVSVVRRSIPELGREQAEQLSEWADEAPGLAIGLYTQGALEMQEQLALILDEMPLPSPERILSFAESVTSGKQHQNWRVFSRLILHWLAAKARAGDSRCAEKWQEMSRDLHQTEARHLDYKSAVIAFFHGLADGHKMVTA